MKTTILLVGILGLLMLVALPASAENIETVCSVCHKPMAEVVDANKHKSLDCGECHVNNDHPGKPTEVRVITETGADNCGRCHNDQYDSFMKVNLKSKAKIEKSIPAGRSPATDTLLMGHGFTKEHNEPRSHAFMLMDYLVVDRAFGGRFQLKNLTYMMNPGKPWDVLEDKGANFTLPETAKAANPVCLQCKSSDNILKWAYMGDKNPKAMFDRTSNVVDVAKSLNHIVGCIQCHDPHSNKPRIVRDALIEAVQRGGVNPYNPDYATKVEVQEFRNFRKIGVLNRPDSNLMCAQCHVEYNCNPGLDLAGNRIGMNDSRTNHFPWKNVFELQKHYDELNFRDFKHTITNASLIKVQHPESETYWQSAHEKAGVECKNCHMPWIKNKAGKEYTSHWQVSPRNYINETCLKCHQWTPEQAEYEIDSVQNYVKGKMRKAEFSLTRFIETFEDAKVSGVNQSTLDEARNYHDTANVLWEWWTAENSDGFHNPEQARESLTKSIEASKNGTALLEVAIAQQKTQTMSQPATPKAAPGFETAAAVMALISLASTVLLRKKR